MKLLSILIVIIDDVIHVYDKHIGENTWSHFTVSGKACRVGSACSKNLVTGFYSCETDNEEIGSWDYCCKSDYPCGKTTILHFNCRYFY